MPMPCAATRACAFSVELSPKNGMNRGRLSCVTRTSTIGPVSVPSVALQTLPMLKLRLPLVSPVCQYLSEFKMKW
jgi:hypothetical protein